MNLLATLRPPTRDEASRAYRHRIAPPPDALAKIVRSVAGDLVVEVTEDEVRIFDEWKNGEKDTTVEAAALRTLQALQLATGWYVFGNLEEGFEPEGQCHACSIERFAWQDDDEACAACGDAPDGEEGPSHKVANEQKDDPVHVSAAKTNESIAEALVDALLQNEWIELVSPSSRKALIRAVAEFLVRHPNCREPAGAAPAESVLDVPRSSPAAEPPSPRALAAMSPGARAAALADVAARAPAVMAARATRDALASAAPKGDPGFDLLDYLTDLPYIAEVYADEDALAALLRGSAAPEA